MRMVWLYRGMWNPREEAMISKEKREKNLLTDDDDIVN